MLGSDFVTAFTSVGRVRIQNQDRYGGGNGVFIVCDGMGSHSQSELAAEIAVDVLLRVPLFPNEAIIREAFGLIQESMLEMEESQPSLAGIGTTISAVWMTQDRMRVAHLGDSRIYRLRNKSLTILTEDHVAGYRDITAPSLTSKLPLLRCMTTHSDVSPDIRTYQIKSGDVYVLATDGFFDPFALPVLERAVLRLKTAQALGRFSESVSGHDNITLIRILIP